MTPIPALLALHFGLAHAQDAVKMEIVRKGQVGTASPRLVLLPQVDARDLAVAVRCGSAPERRRDGPAQPGQRVELELLPVETKAGSVSCTGRLRLAAADGTEGELPLSFQVQMLPALTLHVDRSTLDLGAQRLVVSGDRPLASAEVDVVGPGGEPIGGGRGTGSGAVPVTWTGRGEVVRITVKGFDADGFWSAVELFPWSYAVPHEDLVFATNEAAVLPAEAPKLVAAAREIDKVKARYGAVAKVNLYIAGYTDTVGDAAANQALSERRAQSIAAWFRANGFTGEIWYQGMGERGLAVATPDGTDEPRNRRAAYIVAAEAPPAGDALGARWARLP